MIVTLKNPLEYEQLIKLPQVMTITSRGKSSIYQGIRDGNFPAPVKLSERSVSWKLSDINDWISSLQKTSEM
jgi:prophage regulatory protein